MNFKTIFSRLILSASMITILTAAGSIIGQETTEIKNVEIITEIEETDTCKILATTKATSNTATSKSTTSTTSTTSVSEIQTSRKVEKATQITEIATKEYLLFNKDSKRVHRSSCKYADTSMEIVENGYVEEGRKCSECNPNVEIGTIYEEPTEKVAEDNKGMTFYMNMRGTYYTSSLGTTGRYGKLTSGYSVAINGLDGGTIVYIESDCTGVGGYYQVMDTGGMGYSTVDFFYTAGCVPSDFAWKGNIGLSVWIVD